MKNSVRLFVVLIFVGFAHLSISACTCPGFNPEIYPPNIKEMKKYYRNEFKGAAFTGKVLSAKAAISVTYQGRKTQEVAVEVDRIWLGAKNRTITFYTPTIDSGCWSPFIQNESYFFIPNIDDGILYIGACTYSSFSKKVDGNYVDLMIAMFGKGKKFKNKQN